MTTRHIQCDDPKYFATLKEFDANGTAILTVRLRYAGVLVGDHAEKTANMGHVVLAKVVGEGKWNRDTAKRIAASHDYFSVEMVLIPSLV